MRLQRETQNWNSLRAVAHKMKGSMALMGLKPLEIDLKTIQEYAGKEENLDQLPLLIPPVLQQVTNGIEKIKKIFRREPSF